MLRSMNIRALISVVFALAGLAMFGYRQRDKAGPGVYVPRPKGAITFNKEIGAIVFQIARRAIIG